MPQNFSQYYRAPDEYARFEMERPLTGPSGYFRWDQDAVCYGRTASGGVASDVEAISYDAASEIAIRDAHLSLPFDPEEVTENLLRERYSSHYHSPGRLSKKLIRKAYYAVRPLLGVAVRKHFQKMHLRGWDQIPFPAWPLDCTVDQIHRKRLALAMKARGVEKAPFIWFWPDNFTSCVIVTHDVEAPAGRDFCAELMDIDASYGFHGSYQVVPETRYEVTRGYLDSIVAHGCEVNVHDLTHDGRLYAEHGEFKRRAKKINEYGREFGARGFRSGVLYRNADWYDALDFFYDMSMPNVAHLDPQRGGCCTVMPYFIGNIVELPVTCTQDYSLFHILGDYSMVLWKKQIDMIRSQHGLMSILVHPDYVMEEREQTLYRELLQHLADLRETIPMWAPLPVEAAEWWHQRSQMQLVQREGQWRIEGPGNERARVAYAHLANGVLTYTIDGAAQSVTCDAAI